jgi:hypothetical protein
LSVHSYAPKKEREKESEKKERDTHLVSEKTIKRKKGIKEGTLT